MVPTSQIWVFAVFFWSYFAASSLIFAFRLKNNPNKKLDKFVLCSDIMMKGWATWAENYIAVFLGYISIYEIYIYIYSKISLKHFIMYGQILKL